MTRLICFTYPSGPWLNSKFPSSAYEPIAVRSPLREPFELDRITPESSEVHSSLSVPLSISMW